MSRHFLQHYKTHGKAPSYEELAKLTGLHPRTIYIHMQKDDIMYQEIFESERATLSLMSEEIMMAIANAALKGNSKSQELALQIMYKWAKPEKIEIEDVTPEKYTPEDKKELTDGLAEVMQELGYVKASYVPTPKASAPKKATAKKASDNRSGSKATRLSPKK